MRHHLPSSLLMHTSQPRPTSQNPNPLPKEEKDKQRQIIRQQHTPKNACNNHCIAPQQNPIQQIQTHSKRNRLLPKVHRNEHLARVRRVRINRIRERKREVKERRPVDHRDAGEVAEPVQVSLGGHPVDEESSGRDQHRDEQHAESHLRLTDVVVLAG